MVVGYAQIAYRQDRIDLRNGAPRATDFKSLGDAARAMSVIAAGLVRCRDG